MELTVNGRPYSVECGPAEMLSALLRERLGLTGTKIGCNEAECGSCTVLVNGEPVLACNYPARRAQGKQVLTIEGLAQVWQQADSAATGNGSRRDERPALHPLQEAFVAHGAVQCGFCIPGQIMTAYALLERNPEAGETEVRHALKDTLCRCAGYPSILSAIQAAARKLEHWRTHRTAPLTREFRWSQNCRQVRPAAGRAR